MHFFSISFKALDYTDLLKVLEVNSDFGLSHQMLVEQKVAQLPSVMEPCSSEGDMHLQLQQALNQIHQISTSLGSIQQYYQVQVCVQGQVHKYE